MTKFDKALQAWTNMNPAQRFQIMQKVGYIKSIKKHNAACIAYIAKSDAGK